MFETVFFKSSKFISPCDDDDGDNDDDAAAADDDDENTIWVQPVYINMYVNA